MTIISVEYSLIRTIGAGGPSWGPVTCRQRQVIWEGFLEARLGPGSLQCGQQGGGAAAVRTGSSLRSGPGGLGLQSVREGGLAVDRGHGHLYGIIVN